MNVTKEITGELTAIIKVEIAKEDYEEKVNIQLKDFMRRAAIPGFRPGKAPMGHIKRLYGAAVTAEEINKIVSGEINRYIGENKIKIIGHPLPNPGHTTGLNTDDSGNMTFAFDIGLFPDFELTLDDTIEVEYHKIIVDDKDIDSEIKKLCSTYGELTYPEKSSEEDYLDGHFSELDHEGNPIKGGIHNVGFLRPSLIADTVERERFLNHTKGETITFDLRKCFPSNSDVARSLRLPSINAAAAANGTFSFRIDQITRLVPAQIGPELYQKVFPGHDDIDEDHFREHIKQQIQQQYETESNRLFMIDAVARIVEKHDFSLPESFLKRWIVENSDGKTSSEEMESSFPSMAKDIKWDLIRQKIYREYSIVPAEADLKNIVAENFKHRYSELSENEEMLPGFVDNFMQNEKEVEKLKEQIIASQLIRLFKSTIKIKAVDVLWKDYLDKLIPHYKTHSHE